MTASLSRIIRSLSYRQQPYLSVFNKKHASVIQLLPASPGYQPRFIKTSAHLCFKATPRTFKEKQHSDDELDAVQELDTEDYQQLVHRAQLLPGAGHQVFVIQPYVKWGPKKKAVTTPDLMMEEAIALIDTLPKWTCVDSIKVPLLSLGKKQLFGSGKLDTLKKQIARNHNISAVFVSINQLSALQREELEDAFRVPIYDRYSIVLQIFKERAKTQEAKLQVAFAEIPYLRTSLQRMQAGATGGPSNQGGGKASIRGSGETYFELQVRLLDNREHKIKNELEKLAKKRATLKQLRTKREFPVVAVVGYTNSGKTSLIKALTGDSTIEPKDALFATLDVTNHACRLPCNLSILLVDTVGFISDIPTNLIAAFNATLRDALDADLLVHIRDISHPDIENQVATVNSTLGMLDANLTASVIQVANKVDKLQPDDERLLQDGVLPISATNGTGMQELLLTIQSKVLEVTGRRVIKFRVPNGGEEYSWLNREAAVVNCRSDNRDQEYLVMEAILTKTTFARFRAKYSHIKMFSPS